MVSLADDISWVLPALREQAESMMLDSCTIVRPGAPVTDPDSGAVTASSTPVYSGKCKVQSKDSATATPDAGDHAFTVVSRQVHIPVGAADVKDDDVVTITASAHNPFGVGRKYRVEGFTPDSFDTAARLPVKEITS